MVPSMVGIGFSSTFINVIGPSGFEKEDTCWHVEVDQTLM
jgi:hypothetical protein